MAVPGNSRTEEKDNKVQRPVSRNRMTLAKESKGNTNGENCLGYQSLNNWSII